MYLLVNLLTCRRFEKISLNWNNDFFFTLFTGCLQWLSNSTLLSQGSQRLCNCNDTKWSVSTFVETSCVHWTSPGYPRADPVTWCHWPGKLIRKQLNNAEVAKANFFVSIFAWFIVKFMGSHLIFLPNCFTGTILKTVSAGHLCCCLNNLKYMKNRSIVVRSVFYKCIWFAFLSLICALDFYMLMFSL